jgi:hypothetical protein
VRIRVVQSAGRRYFALIGPKGNIQRRRLFDRTRAKTAGAERRQLSDRTCERLLGSARRKENGAEGYKCTGEVTGPLRR